MNTTTTKRPVATWKKITATGAILLGVGALATGGAFAIFTSSTTADLAAKAGSLHVMPGTNVLAASDLVPGDQIQRVLPITLDTANNGGALVASVTLYYSLTDTPGTDPSNSTLHGSLASDTDGLTYKLLTCTVAWTTGTPAVCPSTGTMQTRTAHTASSATTSADTGTAGKLDTLKGAGFAISLIPADFGYTTATFPTASSDVKLNPIIQLDLPSTADNSYQNASTTLTFTAVANQRAGMQK